MLVDQNKLQKAKNEGQMEFDKATLYPYAKFPA
jgi:hypothetical protein